MRVLDFIVSGQRIEPDPMCDFSNIAPGSREYLHVRFRFSAHWRGFKKVVVFSCRGNTYPTPLLGPVCKIPAEALIGSTVGVSVVGQRGDTRITTNKVSFQQSYGR